MSKKVRKSLAVLAAFVLTISFIAGNGAFTNVHAQEAETETASEQITSTTEASLATEETAAMTQYLRSTATLELPAVLEMLEREAVIQKPQRPRALHLSQQFRKNQP